MNNQMEIGLSNMAQCDSEIVSKFSATLSSKENSSNKEDALHVKLENQVGKSFVSHMPNDFEAKQRDNFKNCLQKMDEYTPVQFAETLFRDITCNDNIKDCIKIEATATDSAESNTQQKYENKKEYESNQENENSGSENVNPILKAMNVNMKENENAINTTEEFRDSRNENYFMNSNNSKEKDVCNVKEEFIQKYTESIAQNNDAMNKTIGVYGTVGFKDTKFKRTQLGFKDTNRSFSVTENRDLLPFQNVTKEKKSCLKNGDNFLHWLRENDVNVDPLVDAEIRRLKSYALYGNQDNSFRSVRPESAFIDRHLDMGEEYGSLKKKRPKKNLFKRLFSKFKRKSKTSEDTNTDVLTGANTRYNKLYLNKSANFYDEDTTFNYNSPKGRGLSKSVNFADDEDIDSKITNKLLKKYEKAQDDYFKFKSKNESFHDGYMKKFEECVQANNIPVNNTGYRKPTNITFYLGNDPTAFKTELNSECTAENITLKMIKDSLPPVGKNVKYYFKYKSSSGEEFFQELFDDKSSVPMINGEPVCKIFTS